jgi:oligoendopeptidase F
MGDYMHSAQRLVMVVIGLLLAVQNPLAAQERDRGKIADKYKWNLADLYASDAAWRDAKNRIAASGQGNPDPVSIPAVAKYKGTLSASPRQLLGCLELVATLNKELSRLYAYASMSLDQDTRVQTYLGMQQEMVQLSAAFGAQASFIEPEILKMDPARVREFIQQEKKLETYRHYLEDILRRKAHTGTEGEEKIIADAGLMADSASSIHSIFSNADFPYPEVTLSSGKVVRLDSSGFALHRASPNREDRKKVFAAYMSRLNEYRRTFGTQLNAQINKDLFYKNARNYGSCLESALNANNIPTRVYHNLVDSVNGSLNTFHRYLKLRQRILGVDQLHYYDLYAPLLADVDLQYTYEESQSHILSALKPLGEDYVATVKRAFDGRWIDVFPTESKRSGAYSNGSAYDVHPYILLNYNGKYDDMSTLAHELGHTMHSYLSNKHQPYATSDYSIFVAEVASTFNEALLIDHMLRQIKEDSVRLSLLGNYLEGIKGTVFRQTQFAEFELRIHEMAERGESLTGDVLNQVYEEIVRKYYGHDQKICIVDDEIKAEWMYIPHFYYNFYVYQYATAFTASAALSEKTLAGDTESTNKFIRFLSSGGSDYPIELLKKAGVDMTTSEPFDLTMKKMNRVMDEMEKILDRMNK